MYKVVGEDTTFNILLYGPPGIGKTWLAATAQDHPEMADVMFLDIEGGMITIASRGDIHAMHMVAIQRFKPTPQMPTLPKDCSTLEDEFWKLASKSPGYENIRTVVIDSGTECQTLNLELIVMDSISKNKAKHKDRDADDIYLEDYGKSTAQLKRIFRYFRDLKINVIITALDMTVFPKGPDGKTKQNAEPIMVRPWFTEKLAKAVMGYMDMNWLLFQEGEERYIMTRDVGIFKGKTRGIRFSKALGPKALIKNEHDPNSKGFTIATLYDLWMETEGGRSA